MESINRAGCLARIELLSFSVWALMRVPLIITRKVRPLRMLGDQVRGTRYRQGSFLSLGRVVRYWAEQEGDIIRPFLF